MEIAIVRSNPKVLDWYRLKTRTIEIEVFTNFENVGNHYFESAFSKFTIIKSIINIQYCPALSTSTRTRSLRVLVRTVSQKSYTPLHYSPAVKNNAAVDDDDDDDYQYQHVLAMVLLLTPSRCVSAVGVVCACFENEKRDWEGKNKKVDEGFF